MFNEKNANSTGDNSQEDINAYWRRKREENEEKIRKIKEENEKYFNDIDGRFRSNKETGGQDFYEDMKNDRKREQEEAEQKRKDDKQKQGDYDEKDRRWGEEQENKKKEEEKQRKKTEQEKQAKKEEKMKQKCEQYSKEFQKKPLNVEKVEPRDYTEQMREEDLKYIDDWMHYEFGRFNWLIDELGIETKRRMEMAISAEDLRRVTEWHYENLKQAHKQFDDKKREIWDLKDRVIKVFLYKKDSAKEKEAEQRVEQKAKEDFDLIKEGILRKLNDYDFGKMDDDTWRTKSMRYQEEMINLQKYGLYQGGMYQSWKKRLEILQKIENNINKFLKEADDAKRKQSENKNNGGGRTTGQETASEGTENKKAEQIAIQELGITFAEYKMIIGNINNADNSEIIRLITKVLQCSNEKIEIKNAYRRWAREWHPDSNNTRFGIGVNETKFKIANNLFGEYNRRFEK